MEAGGPEERKVIGWREWVALPELGIPAVKAKIDTGARTSALHAFTLRTYREGGRTMVRFGIHPLRRRTDIEIFCAAEVIEQRLVSDSGGHREPRLIIRTPVVIAGTVREIEMSLTNRDSMLFRLLLGRTALDESLLVSPAASFLTGRSLARAYRKLAAGKK